MPHCPPSLACCVALIALGCSGDAGPTAVIEGSRFLDAPWPSDSRTNDGYVDIDGFFGDLARGEDLFTLYEQAGAEVRGFSTNPTIYFRFDGPIDTGLLPSPEASVEAAATAFLVNIDRNSPNRGQRIPLTWDFQETETKFQPENLLALQPVWGFPLEARTQYAAVVTTDLAQAPKDFDDVWRSDHPDREMWGPLAEVLFDQRLVTDEVAVATVFTTQDPTEEMALVADAIESDLAVPALDTEVTLSLEGFYYTAYTGQILIPNWQHGDKPYASKGGGFVFEGGRPKVYEWELVDFTVTIPDGEPPADGWPVAIYAHGTGGDHTTFADEGINGREPANVLARAGLAGFGISQPLHGDRWNGSDPTFYVFNYLNPESGLTSFRQGALDVVYLSRVLTEASARFVDEDGMAHVLDPDRVTYIGHSQGGMTGALAAPFLKDRVGGVMLSGTGGGTTLAVTLRTADLDIRALLKDLLSLPGDEELDETHPITALIQLMAEPSDPINYAPYWNSWSPWWDSTPQHVMMTEGLFDIHTPPASTEALAGAAGIPVLEPVSTSSQVALLRGTAGGLSKASANLTAWDDSAVTGGLVQFPDDDHFAIFDNDEAVEMYQTFLRTSVDDPAPEIPAR